MNLSQAVNVRLSVRSLFVLFGGLALVLVWAVSVGLASEDVPLETPVASTIQVVPNVDLHLPYTPQDEMPPAVITYEGDPADSQPVVVSQTTLPSGRINTVVNVPVAQDTYISSGFPNANFGASQTLFIGFDQLRANQQAMRTYVQFDTSQYRNVQVVRAELWMSQSFCSPANDQPMGAVIRHLNGPWNAATLTWANATAPWGGISAQGEIACRGSGYGTADVTELVRQWVAETRPNHGFMIQGDETPRDRQRSWLSRESASLPPFLRLEFNSCTDQTRPTSGMNALSNPITEREFTVSWFGNDPAGGGIDHFDVQYRLQNKTDWRDWRIYTTATSAVFRTQDVPDFASGDVVEFRVRAVDTCGNAQDWPVGPQASTRVLVEFPLARINPFNVPGVIQSNLVTVSWFGDPRGNPPITGFDVQYRRNGAGWIGWRTGVLNTADVFDANLFGGQGFYEFRVRAYDANSRVGEWSGTRGIFFDLEGRLTNQVYLPIATRR